jgi:DNA repair protein RadC
MKELPNKVAEIQITYKPLLPASQRPQIFSSNDAEQIFRKVLDNNLMAIKEEAAILFLNRSNRVIGAYNISSGGITGTVVDIRLILGIALKALACNLILAHTHPSGELKPSQADLDLTKRIKESAKLMEISLLDHLIISTESYFSFADEGVL